MATEFLRLYRELCKQDIDKPVPDPTFLHERKVLLKKLGHKIGSSPDPVRIPKHHGKSARLKCHEAKLKAISSKSGDETKRLRELRESIRIANAAYEMNKELKMHLEANEPIPNKLYKELFGTSKPTGKSGTVEARGKSTGGVILPTIPRKPNLHSEDDDRMKSVNYWGPLEIERLNKIYWELELPPDLSRSKQKTEDNTRAARRQAWDNYYKTFAKRYQLFYPLRSEREVIKKVSEYLLTHRFKEPGENEYWGSVKRREDAFA